MTSDIAYTRKLAHIHTHTHTHAHAHARTHSFTQTSAFQAKKNQTKKEEARLSMRHKFIQLHFFENSRQLVTTPLKRFHGLSFSARVLCSSILKAPLHTPAITHKHTHTDTDTHTHIHTPHKQADAT